MTKKTLQNFIFDFDGTIADSYEFTINKIFEFAEERGIQGLDRSNVDYYRNIPPKKLLADFKLPLWLIPRIVKRYRKEYLKNLNSIDMIEDIDMVINELKNNEKTTGILTTNSKKAVKLLLKGYGISGLDFLRTESSIFKKEVLLRKIVKRYKLKKQETIYIGDEVRDVEGAKKAGILSGAVSWGLNGKKILKEQHPDYFFNTPRDILKLL